MQSEVSYCNFPATGRRVITSDTEFVHLFTPQEAGKLLPDIKPKVKELVELKRSVEELQSELNLYGMIGYTPRDLVESAARLDSYVERIRVKKAELEDLGVNFTDFELGLVDFPAEKFGETVFLCWRYGEPEVAYWHKEGECYVDRKPIGIQVIQR